MIDLEPINEGCSSRPQAGWSTTATLSGHIRRCVQLVGSGRVADRRISRDMRSGRQTALSTFAYLTIAARSFSMTRRATQITQLIQGVGQKNF
jgi:hypothetical protein